MAGTAPLGFAIAAVADAEATLSRFKGQLRDVQATAPLNFAIKAVDDAEATLSRFKGQFRDVLTPAPLSFAIKAVADAEATLKQVRGQLQDVNDTAEKGKGHLGGFGSALGSVAGIAGGFVLGSGILAAPGFLMDAAQAAADDEASTLKLKTAVENTGASWDKYSDQLDATISTAQRKGFTDDEARDALSLLMAQTGDATEAQKRFTLAQDLSRGSGLDLATSSKLLGKVTEENANVFKKMGINLEKGASEAEAFGAIQAKFGGQSDAFANSTAGHFAALKIQMGELKEKIGYALLPIMSKLGEVLINDIVPGISYVVDVAMTLGRIFKDALTGNVQDAHAAFMELSPELWGVGQAFFDAGSIVKRDVIPAVKDFLTTLKEDVVPFLQGELGAAFAQLQQTIAGLIPVVQDIIHWFDEHRLALIPLIAALAVLVIAFGGPEIAIIALIAAGTLLLAHWDEISAAIAAQIVKIQALYDKWTTMTLIGPIIQGVIDGITLIFTSAFETYKAIFQTSLDFIEGIIKLATDLWHGDFGKFWDDLKALIGTMFDDVKAIFTIQLDLVKGLISTALTMWIGVITDGVPLMLAAGTTLLTGLWDGIKKYSDDVLYFFFVGFPLMVLGWLGDLLPILYDKGTDLLQGLYDGASGLVTNTILPFFVGLPGQMVTALGDLLPILWGKGTDLLAGLKNGAVEMIPALVLFFTGLPGQIAGWIGDVGGAIARAVIAGFKEAWNAAAGVINQAIPDSIGFNAGPFGHVGIDLPDNPIPTLGAGAIVRARPGGTLAILGEGRHDEAVIPLPYNSTGAPERVGGRGSGDINFHPGAIVIQVPNALVVDGATVEYAVRTILPEIKRQLVTQGSWGLA